MIRACLACLVVAVGCGGEVNPRISTDAAVGPDAPTPDAGVDSAPPADAPDAPVDAGPDVDAPPAVNPYAEIDEGCAPIFSQLIVPEYHLTIGPDDWAAMQAEFLNPQLDANGTLIEPPYHPTQLHIVEGDATFDPPGVMVRLNGNTSWLQTIVYDANPKMQFLIAFNKVDHDARFEDQRRIKLDMPRADWTFLQQRVALAWLRGRAEIPAQCANSARVFVNGSYYGLYANVEFQDKSFLKRVYGAADNDGDLWKSARTIKTNEETFTWTRITAFWDLFDLAGLDSLVDVDRSMDEWASEAVIGDTDGYNQGRPNFFLYDRPSNHKFVWLANDLDTTLDEDFLPPDTSPVFAPPLPGESRWERDWHHYLFTLADAAGVARYVQAMQRQLPRLDPDELTAWITAWSAQIADAVAADPHRAYTMTAHADALVRMQGYAPARASYLQDWLDCWSTGGADADGDGFDLCHDCQDADPARSPAATEVCDDVDNDCNGRVDDVPGGPEACEPPDADPAAARRQALWRKVLADPKAHRRR